jgi:VWFA-related protein
MIRASIAPVALGLVLVSAVVSATPQSPQATFKSSIELIHVDATVVDKDGVAVRGLTLKDFALFDRKKPQTIATFTEESHERAVVPATSVLAELPPTVPVGVASNTAVQADRLVMMVIDDLHIWKGRTDQAKKIARDAVTQLGGQASMAVVFTSGEGSTQVTADRAILLKAVETLKGRQSIRRPHQATDTQHAAALDPEGDMAKALDTVAKSQQTNLQDFEDNMRWLQTLDDVAKMLRAEDQRRKAFVMISEGMAKSINGIFDSEQTPCEMSGAPCYHDNTLRKMMESLRRSNVTTYSIDPRGKIKPEDMMLESFPPPSCAACVQGDPGSAGVSTSRADLNEDSQFRWNNPIRQAQDGLTTLSEASGGFAVTDTDDFTAGLGRIIEDIDHYYVLGFYPADPMGNKYRPLDVTVPGHPDWTVHYRHGYTPGTEDVPKPNADPLVELARGVMPKSDLPLRLTAIPLIGNGKNADVMVALEVTAPTGLMKDADAKLRDDIAYSVLVVDDQKSKVATRTGRTASVALSARNPSAAMPDSVSYQIPLLIELKPGRYQLRASATSKRLGKGGSVYFDVTVPDFANTALQLSGITLGYGDGAHVAVGRPEVSAAQQLPSRQFGMRDAVPPAAPPKDAARLPFEPSLDRVFNTTDALNAYFEVARRDPSTTVRMTITIADKNNRTLMAIDRAVGPGERGDVTLRVPLGPLTTGVYRLRAVASDGHQSAVTETGFAIR